MRCDAYARSCGPIRSCGHFLDLACYVHGPWPMAGYCISINMNSLRICLARSYRLFVLVALLTSFSVSSAVAGKIGYAPDRILLKLKSSVSGNETNFIAGLGLLEVRKI